MSEPDEFEVFTKQDKFKDFTSCTSAQTPFCYDFKRFDDRDQYYNLCFDTESDAPAVRECIIIDTSLHVSLSHDKIAPSQGSAWLKILHCI